jgi:hypothetical protein
MLAADIIQLIKNKGYGAWQSSLRTAIIYLLFDYGYKSRDIANALGVCSNNISYYQNKAEDLIYIKDKTFLNALDELKQHDIALNPYFTERIGSTRTIRIKLTIDNIKL